MIIVPQQLDATLFLNHFAMTATLALMITEILPLANVFSNQSIVMIIANVLMMNVYLIPVAVTRMFHVMITMLVLRIHVIQQLDVYLPIFLHNVKLITNVTKITVVLLLGAHTI
jgi:hypothetical protein